MKTNTVFGFILATGLLQAIATENIQTGENGGIPDREDIQKERSEPQPNPQDEKKEERENQEDKDPAFYDSTTSPGEMHEDSLREL